MVNYCEVAGCLNKKSNKSLSFFSLPKDEERRKKWLDVIGRPDLINNKWHNHVVCSLHFDKTMIKFTPHLVADAIPTKLLPDQPGTSNANTNEDCGDVSTQTVSAVSAVTIKGPDKEVQTISENTKNVSTQTTLVRSTDTPRKRKLRNGRISDPKQKKASKRKK